MILRAWIASFGHKLLILTSLSSKVFEIITSCAKKIFLLIKMLAMSLMSTLCISEERKWRFMIVILPSSILIVSGNRSMGNACEEMLARILLDFLTRLAIALLFNLFCLSVALDSFSISLAFEDWRSSPFSSRSSTSCWVYNFSGWIFVLPLCLPMIFSVFIFYFLLPPYSDRYLNLRSLIWNSPFSKWEKPFPSYRFGDVLNAAFLIIVTLGR